MNISRPEISRTLATLIQRVPAEGRDDFVAKAEAAKDIKTFVEEYFGKEVQGR